MVRKCAKMGLKRAGQGKFNSKSNFFSELAVFGSFLQVQFLVPTQFDTGSGLAPARDACGGEGRVSQPPYSSQSKFSSP